MKTTKGFGTLFSESRDNTLNNIRSPEQIRNVLELVRPNFKFSYKNKSLKYYDVPIMFDIESSSFYDRGEKRACMYMWSFCIYGVVVIGRTWEEFVFMLQFLTDELDLREDKRIIIYVHNLQYEFQFLRKWLYWDKVFAIDSRKPLYALSGGIEFRCSYLLSGYSLANLPILKYNVKKLTGTINYDLVRTPESKLNDNDILYSAYDSLVGVAYIQEKIENDGGIARIPLTKTGYVRNYCKKKCFHRDKDKNDPDRIRGYDAYRKMMNNLRIGSKEEYMYARKAFLGGFTHANSFMVNKVLYNVKSRDITSSYPAAMCSEKYPMSKGEWCTISGQSELINMMNEYCVILTVRFTNLESKLLHEQPISYSRCSKVINDTQLNGRIFKADIVEIITTDQDLLTYVKFYSFEKMEIGKCIRYKKHYLPKEIVESVLTFYDSKNKLKGIEGKEVEYLNAKENTNSTYGMMVTNIIRDEIVYDAGTDEWSENIPTDLDKLLEKYNNSASRFLFYLWGVWVTAYARKNLFKAIEMLGEDYIYADTDAVYYLYKTDNEERFNKWFENYNKEIKEKISNVCSYHKIDVEMTRPKNNKGEVYQLGFFEPDSEFDRFKTLGAKRYFGEKNGKFKLTVAGLGKEIAKEYITSAHKGEEFEFFNDNMVIPKDYTGKLTMTYIDEEVSGYAEDCEGVTRSYHELSCVHSEKQEYHLGCENYMSIISHMEEKK